MSIAVSPDAEASPIEPSLDHLVYATVDLERTVAEFTEITGVPPVPGGRHLGRGSRNYLVGFGATSYLEIIGPDPENPADEGRSVPFGIDALTAPKLTGWAVHPADIDRAAAASAAAGADLGEVGSMSRRTPDGALLQWRIAAADPAPLGGITPFLIDWGETPHPAAESGLTLLGLRATHPDPEAVGAVLDALGVRLPVASGDPRLTAVLETPNGRVRLG
jgi:hypothetical protein